MNKTFVLFISVLLASVSFSQSKDVIQKKINDYQQNKQFKNSQWCLYAEYLDNSDVIFDFNSHYSVAPASGLKVFTSIAALDVLGENYQFETKIYFDGTIKNSVLDGDVYIVGGGDPSLGSDLVKEAYSLDELEGLLIQAFRKFEVKKVTGSIIADNSLYDIQPVPDNWEYIDVGNYYGAASTALSINNNLYYLYFEPGNNVGDVARVLRTDPDIPGLKFTNLMKTGEEGSGDNGYIYCPPLSSNAIIKGTIPKGVKEFSIKGSIPDPPLFTAQFITNVLRENGIEIIGEAQKIETEVDYKYSTLAAVIKSPPLKDIVFILNKRSSNLFAELLLKAIAYKQEGVGKTSLGTKAIRNYLEQEQINTDGLRLYDGSGLSRANGITAKMMVDLLKNVTKKDYYNSFYNSLGVFGKSDDIGFSGMWEKVLQLKIMLE
jgi:D-alanyl-D-alanine carboxypeptidase/D-alanyl-D-alanine-endopeptidase (penicillin-binding protein 4)